MRSACLALMLLLGGSASIANAQEDFRSLASARAPLAGPIDPERYRLGPGDVLTLFIAGTVVRSAALEVGPEGVVVIPDIGLVDVSGLSLNAARDRITSLVRSRLRGVSVDVRLAQVRQFRLWLTGDVVTPGTMVVQGGSSLGDVLVDSLLTPSSSRRQVQVLRSDGNRAKVDLARVRLLGQRESDVLLGDGDIVQVPTLTHTIGAWGGVSRPGPHEWSQSDSLSTLLSLAGGLTADAISDRALMIRWSSATDRESVWVDLRAGSSMLALPLADGDQLHVFRVPSFHESPQATVIGRVGRAGTFPIERGRTRISQIVAAAGGLAADADASALRLIRRRPDGIADPEFDRLVHLSREEMTESEYESFRSRLAARTPDFRIDWKRVAEGDAMADAVLEDGDILRVERLTSSVRVDGQVRRPGLVAHRAGMKWPDYVAAAGGYSARAARTQVRLTRAADQKTVRVADAGAIAPGDLVWVPERPDVSAWTYVRDGLLIATQVATLIIAIRN